MNSQEQNLFINLCKFKSEEFDESLLDYATPAVLGHLFFNRMQGIAYGTLKKHNLLSKVNREFRNSLRVAYEQNQIKNQSYFQCLKLLNVILRDCTCKYALLKGALLCRIYPEGYRTSNDIDLLVSPEDVTEIGQLLKAAGFQQGNIRNDQFTPATRREIIESKMMRGETVPYIKEVNLPGMKYMEVDINFSLDYKNGDTDTLHKMLNGVNGFNGIQTLDDHDFFLHLCGHLYKEAATIPWIRMKRDMTLYKYCDIYLLLSEMNAQNLNILFQRAKQLGLEKICSFVIVQTMELFNIEHESALLLAKQVLINDPSFLHTVISPRDQKLYVYAEKNIAARFFAEERIELLKEVKNNATLKNAQQ